MWPSRPIFYLLLAFLFQSISACRYRSVPALYVVCWCSVVHEPSIPVVCPRANLPKLEEYHFHWTEYNFYHSVLVGGNEGPKNYHTNPHIQFELFLVFVLRYGMGIFIYPYMIVMKVFNAIIFRLSHQCTTLRQWIWNWRSTADTIAKNWL